MRACACACLRLVHAGAGGRLRTLPSELARPPSSSLVGLHVPKASAWPPTCAQASGFSESRGSLWRLRMDVSVPALGLNVSFTRMFPRLLSLDRARVLPVPCQVAFDRHTSPRLCCVVTGKGPRWYPGHAWACACGCWVAGFPCQHRAAGCQGAEMKTARGKGRLPADFYPLAGVFLKGVLPRLLKETSQTVAIPWLTRQLKDQILQSVQISKALCAPSEERISRGLDFSLRPRCFSIFCFTGCAWDAM